MDFYHSLIDRYELNCWDMNIVLLLLFGCWTILENERNIFLRTIRFLPFLELFGICGHVFILLSELSSKLSSVWLLSEWTVMIIINIKSSVRLSMVLVRMSTLQDIVRGLDALARYVKQEDEVALFKRYKRRAQVFTLLNVVYCCCCGLVFTLEPLFDKLEKRFSGHVILPSLEWYESPFYEMFYICHTTLGFGHSATMALGDSLYLAYLITVTGFFKVLQLKLENCKKKAEKVVDEKNIINKKTVGNETTRIWIDGPGVETHRKVVVMKGVKARLGSGRIGGGERFGVDSPYLEKKIHVDRLDRCLGKRVGVERVDYCELDVLTLKGSRGRRGPKTTRVYPDLKTRLKVWEEQRRRQVETEMVKHLKECVDFQVEILRSCRFLQDKFGMDLLFDMSAGTFLIALDSFQIATVTNTSTCIVWISFLLIHLMQVFSFCWAASDLAHESANVSDAMYLSDWLDTHPSYKRYVQVIMSCSVQPVILTAGSFFKISLVAFINILNSSVSYFNVARSLHSKN